MQLERGGALPVQGLFTNAVLLKNHVEATTAYETAYLSDPTAANWVSHKASFVHEASWPFHRDEVKVGCFDSDAAPQSYFRYKDEVGTAQYELPDKGPEGPARDTMEADVVHSALEQCKKDLGDGELSLTPLTDVETREGRTRCSWAMCVTTLYASHSYSCRVAALPPN